MTLDIFAYSILFQTPYQYKRSQRLFGNESMAIVFSLPWALLMWSYVFYYLSRCYSQYSRISVSPTGYGEQDGVIFHCAVAVMLHTHERIYTYLRRGHVGHGGLPGRLGYSDCLAIER
jgi:hypothetical protein